MSNQQKPPKKIVIFASGNGTNAENIIKHFQKSEKAEVVALFSNRRSAGALKKAHDLNVKALHFDKEAIYHSHEVLNVLRDMKPDLIVLAGFLWLMPKRILQQFSNKVINIHPALLPAYGGKGMYGSRVHEAVIANKEKESGISIHYVNDQYDEGRIIFQARTQLDNTDTPDSLAQKIHELEYRHFPEVIEELLEKQA
ncbi:MAG: phosphoribosylglycinamide formyltransferase [Bacteroidota bacterium]|uniref:Phosphoribosylglycinamide formyltransferase n=1 Tax=Christiangramia flava JLT2011 TaxID=1229726 RepID=A0A1L7I4S0_9FLAO|nr:phosphoribosylglycinamide formyltransferase [Christiangramia flava]APU68214.1 Phosphoribosylglycinamide formyltransferase [Christiangramia flava JLT2011]MAM19542.1 phosphoribosylglycinamide formyltransferase [Christiangramia sp.]MEE2773075.1 phosphoribosylglycinamide formyltransferase [Bacteroidota bacterium]OSS40999.1 Phosphoribosylglycinamide formyltransferase [Christiangramia flava JLT2011]